MNFNFGSFSGPNQPFPVEVRVDGCDKQPCTVVKGKDIIFEIDFTAGMYYFTEKYCKSYTNFSIIQA